MNRGKPKKEKQIQIDESLFNDLIWVFESLDIQRYEEGFREGLESVVERLKSKQNALKARQAYKDLVEANKSGDEEQQTMARMEYLDKKTNRTY